MQRAPEAVVTAPVSGPKTKEQKRAEAEARQRAYRAGRTEKLRLGVVDAELSVAQARYDELVAALGDSSTYARPELFDAAMGEYSELKARIAELEREWLVLTEALDALGEGID